MTTLKIGTRGSALALAQSNMIRTALMAAQPELAVELVIITTKGDLILDRALSRIGDKGLFVTEIEQALLRGEIDLAVHSCKDLPAETLPGLALAAFPRRADPRDALVSRHGLGLRALPVGARIGTSSLRRTSQLRAFRPDFAIVNLRGNVDTRLRKARSEDYDAIVLAAAGLHRLGLDDAITEYLEPDILLPAVAQGTLALECRADDARTLALVAPLNDAATAASTVAERALLARLHGGCQVPIAAWARHTADGLELHGMIGTPDGQHVVRAAQAAPLDAPHPAELGIAVAELLLERGGYAILEQLRHVIPAVEILAAP